MLLYPTDGIFPMFYHWAYEAKVNYFWKDIINIFHIKNLIPLKFK